MFVRTICINIRVVPNCSPLRPQSTTQLWGCQSRHQHQERRREGLSTRKGQIERNILYLPLLQIEHPVNLSDYAVSSVTMAHDGEEANRYLVYVTTHIYIYIAVAGPMQRKCSPLLKSRDIAEVNARQADNYMALSTSDQRAWKVSEPMQPSTQDTPNTLSALYTCSEKLQHRVRILHVLEAEPPG
jgi:hypothetical protein